jgi:NADH-quinone oxidoreductase subunit E
MAVRFSEATYRKFEEILTRYPPDHRRAAILPTFWLAYKEFGHLGPPVLEYVAGLLGLSAADAASVASFYTMFPPAPLGKYHLQVCTNLPCTLLGAEGIVRCVEKRLGVRPGETTPDGRFTLSEVECLGSCGTAPVVQVNEDYHENLSPEQLLRLLDRLTKE